MDTVTLGLASSFPLKLGMMFAQQLTNAVEIEQIVMTQFNKRFGELKRGAISSLEKKPNLREQLHSQKRH